MQKQTKSESALVISLGLLPLLLFGSDLLLPQIAAHTLRVGGGFFAAWLCLCIVFAFRAKFSLADEVAKLGILNLVLWGVPFLLATTALFLEIGTLGPAGHRTITMAVYLLGVLALHFSLKESKSQFQTNLLWSVSAGLAAYGVMIGIAIAMGFLGDDSEWVKKLSFPGFSNIRHLAYLVAPAFLVTVYLTAHLFTNQGRIKLVFGLVVCLILSSLIFVSGSRAGLAAVLFGFLATQLTYRKKNILVLAIVFGTLTGGALIAGQYQLESRSIGLESFFNRKKESSSMDELSSGRIAVWKDTFQQAMTRPLLGHGLGQYPYKVKGGTIIQVHNFFFEYLLAIGIIGTACLSTWLGLAWLRVSHFVTSVPQEVLPALPALAGINTLGVFSMLDGVFFHYNPLLISAVLFSVGLLAAKPRP